MSSTCSFCKYGLERSPDGKRPPAGTVWCSKRKIPMGQNRSLTCFMPLVTDKGKRCQDCRWAKMLKPTGEAPVIGRVWCERRHFEINKMRVMECYDG